MTLPIWRQRLRGLLAPAGYSLTELMVVVVVIGILSGVVIDAGIRDWRRERVNTVIVELAGWLETVRRDALRGRSCTVTINAGSLAPGGQLANSDCRGTFSITAITGNHAFEVTSNVENLTFTPAGTLFPARPNESPAVITVRLADDPEPQRCVELDGLLGLISVGRSTSPTACDTANRF